MGEDSAGQLGNGVGQADTSQPQRLSTDVYTAIAAGLKHVLAVRSDGTLWAWGYNNKGQLGVGSTSNKEVPTQVGTDSDWATVGGGYNFSFGIKTNGSLWAWGENGSYGYLGIGSTTSYRTVPTQIDAISTTASTPPASGAGAGAWYLSPPTVTLTTDQAGTTQYQWNGTTEDGWTNYTGTFATSEGQNDLKYRSIDSFGVTESVRTRKVWVDLADPTKPTDLVSITHSTTDAIVNEYIAVQWTGSTDGVSGIDGYDYSFTKGATDKPDGVKDVEQGVLAITSDALTGGGWYFHVRAIDNAGRIGQTEHAGPFQITASFSQVSAGGDSNGYMSHTLALKDDGSLWAWGLNNNGQLGDGTTIDATRPIQIGSDIDWSEVSAGDGFSLGLKTSGEVWAWGRNSDGQLGDGTTSSSLSPVQVIGVGGSGFLTDAVQIAAGSRHALARRSDNTLAAWGANNKGQLGVGDYVDTATPDAVLVAAGNLTSATDIDAGGDQSAAIRSPGSLWTWGYNFYGQLGDSSNSNRNKGVQESRNWTTWTGLAVGRSHTVARLSSGLVYAFGLNDKGQLGDGTNTDRNIATALSGTGYDATGVAAGNEHSVVLQSDWTIRSFGSGANGQLARSSGLTGDANKFVAAGGGMTTFLTADAGANHTVAIKDNKSVWVWGANESGQLGDGTLVDKLTPLQIVGDQITTFSTNPSIPNGSSGWFTFAPSVTLLAAAPGVTRYQLDATADGSWTTYSSSFTAPEGSHTIYYFSTDVLAGVTEDIQSQSVDLDTVDPTDPYVYSSSHTTGDVSYDNTIDITWNGAADLTSGVDGFSFSYTEGVTELPDTVKDAEETVTSDTSSSLAAGDWYFNLRTLDNAGNWTSTVHVGPFTIESPWAQIEVGVRHTLAIKDDGTLWAWGFNRYGQLGDGTIVDSHVPVQVGAATNWTDIAVGMEHSMGLLSNGRLYGWGRNTKGQLGNGSTAEQHSPVQVYGSWNSWSEVDAGARHTIARRGGWLYGWGDNLYGQLGALAGGDSSTHTRPLRESMSYTNWTAIGTGDYTSFGIRSTGHLWAWGYNKQGQLGVGNSGSGTNRSAPTLVRGNFTNWVEVDGGNQHTVARQSNGKTYAWGNNSLGQLGNNTTVDALLTPTRVSMGPAASDIEVGSNFSLARATDGRIYTWGYNSRGQLGQADTDIRYLPTQVGTGNDWDIIAAGDQSAIAVRTSGEAWVWGYNFWGMLGNDSVANSLSPILMSGIETTASLIPLSPDGLNGWYVTNPTVTLTSNEPGSTQYQWGVTSGTWTNYGVSFDASEGENTLYYRSIDLAGNTEDASSLSFKVDTVDPTDPGSVSSDTHTVGVANPTDVVHMNWSAGIDATSGVVGYSVVWDQSSNSVPDTTVDTAGLESSSPALSGGDNYFHLSTCDEAGLCTSTVHEGPYVIGPTPVAPQVGPNFVSGPSLSFVMSTSALVAAEFDVPVQMSIFSSEAGSTWDAAIYGTSHNVTMSNLLPGTQYSTVVTGTDVTGDSVTSDALSFSTPSGSSSSGATSAGVTVEPVVVNPDPDVSIVFSDITADGSTTVIRTSVLPLPAPNGYEFAGSLYELNTTAGISGPIYVAFRYDESQIEGSEENLVLFHHDEVNDSWDNTGAVVDIENNIIYARVTHFSHFGIGFPASFGHVATGGGSTAALAGLLLTLLGFSGLGVRWLRSRRLSSNTVLTD